MDLLVYDDTDQRYVPLLVAVLAALLTGLLIGGLAFFLTADRTPPAESISGATTPQAGVQDASTCAEALQQADAALELAARVDSALGEQTSVMEDLLAKRLTEQQAVDRALPPLTSAAKDRQAFRAAVRAYREASAAC